MTGRMAWAAGRRMTLERHRMILRYIADRFGTHRGLVRLLLANLRRLAGGYRDLGTVNWGRVERIVFVCQGNICRSPFAHHRCASLPMTIPLASIGLATTTGAPANGTAVEAARAFSVDMTTHRATDIRDFACQDGDLFLVMEDRHVAPLRRWIAGKDVQLGLLGLWCRPRYALLYDPFNLGRTYFDACFRRIEDAVVRMAEEARAARPAAGDR